jgi:hypothetical protein
LVGCYIFALGLAQPAWAEKPRMLVMDFKATLVKEEIVTIITDLVGTELTTYAAFEIITGADMRQMAELEAEKQSMGCGEDSSCLAELAGAMGARFVAFGSVGKLGKNIIITLNLFDSEHAKSVGRENIRATSLDTLPDQIPVAIKRLISGVLPKEEALIKVAVHKSPVPEFVPKPASQDQKLAKTETVPPAKNEEVSVQGKTPKEEVKTSSLALVMGTGIAAVTVGLVSAGYGTWGFTGAPGLVAQPDIPASTKEMAVSAYESSPAMIGIGSVAIIGGAALLFWPAEGGEE